MNFPPPRAEPAIHPRMNTAVAPRDGFSFAERAGGNSLPNVEAEEERLELIPSCSRADDQSAEQQVGHQSAGAKK